MNLFSRVKFIWKRPKVIVVTGKNRVSVKEAIFQLLKQYPQVSGDILLSETELKDSKDIEELKFLSHNSSAFVFVLSSIEEKEMFQEIQGLAKTMPAGSWLVLNFDDEKAKEMMATTNLRIFTFGFEPGADFKASDINTNGGTNFKINYKENIVPVWLQGLCGKEQIYPSLAAACVATIFGLNLIEISQALKNYQFSFKKE
jgi:hypothetical protein